MVFKKEQCTKCKNMNTILPSNNDLVPDLCDYCINEQLNYNNIEDADFFCRTFNYPFYPEKWMKLTKMYKKDTFKEYINWVRDENPDNLKYEGSTHDLWRKVNEEWELSLTHEELIAALQPIKEDYLRRNRIKWGSDYTFEELISLENLFVNTLEANDISNPMQIDAIKKACKLSIALDRAIVNGESKEINDLSNSYQKFIKTAQIDSIITASSKDVISNVSELVAYIEEEGFEMPYYDEVERDIVDKSLKDIKEYIKRLILDSTGLEAVFDQMNEAVREEEEMKEESASYDKVKLEDLYKQTEDKYNEEIDSELASDDVNEDMFEEDDDDGYYFED